KHCLLRNTRSQSADERPARNVAEIDARIRDHVQEHVDEILFAAGSQSIDDEEIEQAVVVVIAELRRPAPQRLAGAGLAGQIREGTAGGVLPEQVGLSHGCEGAYREGAV